MQNQSSKAAPALAVFENKLWIAFVANDASNQLLVSSSADGSDLEPSTQVQHQSSKAAPALAVFENRLWIAFVANDASNQLLVSHSAGGKNWSPSTKVQNQSSKAAPALAVFENRLWIAFVANDASNQSAGLPLRRWQNLEPEHPGAASVQQGHPRLPGPGLRRNQAVPPG